MSLFDGIRSFFSGGGRNPVPELPSIYAHISAHLREDGPGLLEGGDTLPDDALVRSGAGFGWVPGAMDGAVVRHFDGAAEEPDRVDLLYRALFRLSNRPSRAAREEVLRVFLEGGSRTLLEPLLTRLQEKPPRDQERLYAEMRPLVLATGHREVLKFALVILSAFRNADDLELFLTAGRHEEFTFLAAIAVANVAEEPSPYWLQLAKNVTGWGRIELTELLLADEEPAKGACDFLLREGASNGIMNEYTALSIATRCRLHEALAKEPEDSRLTAGAASILAALAAEETGGGPGAGGMLEYSESGEATERFLARVAVEHMTLNDYLALDSIRAFAHQEQEDEALERCGWTSARKERIREALDGILGDKSWPEKARAALESRDDRTHYSAMAVAQSLGLPLREHVKQRLEEDPLNNLWFELVKNPTEAKMDEALEMSSRLLDLEAIGTGPATELGLGPGYELHSAADSLLQALRAFPGKGWELIRPALRSPVVRNRNMALAALEEWPREAFTDEVRDCLERCVDGPHDEVGARCATLLERNSQGESSAEH